jgi:hypothetical protein
VPSKRLDLIPDIMYADGVTLISHTAAGAQQLLDVPHCGPVHVLCKLFGMEVNLSPCKTCVVVFRPGNVPMPVGLQLLYRGHTVAVQRESTYLGV